MYGYSFQPAWNHFVSDGIVVPLYFELVNSVHILQYRKVNLRFLSDTLSNDKFQFIGRDIIIWKDLHYDIPSKCNHI